MLATLEIQSSEQTPYIKLDPFLCEIILSGVSRPENTFTFYAPVMHWLERFLEEGRSKSISVRFDIICFNTSSSRIFLELLELFDDAAKKGMEWDIVWYYNQNDEDSLEIGKALVDEYGVLDVQFLPRSV